MCDAYDSGTLQEVSDRASCLLHDHRMRNIVAKTLLRTLSMIKRGEVYSNFAFQSTVFYETAKRLRRAKTANRVTRSYIREVGAMDYEVKIRTGTFMDVKIEAIIGVSMKMNGSNVAVPQLKSCYWLAPTCFVVKNFEQARLAGGSEWNIRTQIRGENESKY